jgi:hypothetical protein
MGKVQVEISAPGPDEHDLAPAPLHALIQSIGVDAHVHTLTVALNEGRVIFVGSDMALVSNAVYALVTLIYPFAWQHPVAPVLPARMLDAVCAPFPYVYGLAREHVAALEERPLDNVLVVDIDTGALSVYGGDTEGSPTIVPLPSAPRAKLRRHIISALEEHAEELGGGGVLVWFDLCGVFFFFFFFFFFLVKK